MQYKTAEPMINGRSLFEWRAKTLSYSINPISYKNGYMVPAGSMVPVKLNPKLGLRKIIITLDIYGDTKEEISHNISALTKELMAGAELFMPDDYYYSVVFDGMTAPVEKAPWIEQIKVTVSGYKHGAPETNKITTSGTVQILGDLEAPAKMTVVSTSSTATIGINVGTDRELSYVISTASGTTVIDGIAKTVTKSGANKFKDMTMVEFPKLVPGNNSIKLTNVSSLLLEYCPMYV